MNLTAVGWLQAVQTSALFVSICSILKLIQTLSPSVNMSDVSNETESHCSVFESVQGQFYCADRIHSS